MSARLAVEEHGGLWLKQIAHSSKQKKAPSTTKKTAHQASAPELNNHKNNVTIGNMTHRDSEHQTNLDILVDVGKLVAQVPEVLKVSSPDLLEEGLKTTFTDSQSLGNVDLADNIHLSELNAKIV